MSDSILRGISTAALAAAVFMAPEAAAAFDPGSESTLLLIGGTLNGKTVSPSDRIVAVEPGERITGNVEVEVNSAWASSAVMAIGYTPNWGDHSSSFVTLPAFRGPVFGLRRNAAFDLVAPEEPGTYWLIFAYRAEFTTGQVFSSTNWSVGQLFWDNGDDVAGWADGDIETANASGQVQVPVRVNGGTAMFFVPAPAIQIQVGGSPVYFDGFAGDLDEDWVVSGGYRSGAGGSECSAGRDPQYNIFCRDLVLSLPGRVELEGFVEDGVRYGAEVASRKTFAAEGTFAAKVRLSGPIENPRSHASIKAFFTHGSWPKNGLLMEHDFEILTGLSRLYFQREWLSQDEADDPSPHLVTVTHADGGERQRLSTTASLGAFPTDTFVLVLQVRCVFDCGLETPGTFEAVYHLVTPDGGGATLGSTLTKHDPSVAELRPMFNLWWLNPAGAETCPDPGQQPGPPTSQALPPSAPSQFLEVDWFLASAEILDPIEAAMLGEEMDAGFDP